MRVHFILSLFLYFFCFSASDQVHSLAELYQIKTKNFLENMKKRLNSEDVAWVKEFSAVIQEHADKCLKEPMASVENKDFFANMSELKTKVSKVQDNATVMLHYYTLVSVMKDYEMRKKIGCYAIEQEYNPRNVLPGLRMPQGFLEAFEKRELTQVTYDVYKQKYEELGHSEHYKIEWKTFKRCAQELLTFVE